MDPLKPVIVTSWQPRRARIHHRPENLGQRADHPGRQLPDSRQPDRARSPALLRGIIFTADGRAMTPHHTRRRSGRMYRYYLSTRDNKEGYGASGVRMLPAGEVEGAVLAQLRANLRSPDMAAMVWQEVQKLGESMTETEVGVALTRIDEIWEQLFPAEQARVVRLLVERITVTPSELHVKLRPNGIEQMALEIGREMTVEECEAA